MGLLWLLMAGACCMHRISAYNTERLTADQSEPVNLELDLFPVAETNKFYDIDKSDSFEESMLSPTFDDVETTRPPGTPSTQKRMFVFFVHSDNTGASNESTPLDSWSVVWYVASFGGLIIFFLIVSCSEWCCRRAIRNSQSCSRNTPTTAASNVPDTPPPSYDQFAPPSYESICLGRNGRGGEKSEYDIYVVPVHALGTLVQSRPVDAPPSYLSASVGTFTPALSNDLSRIT